MDISAAQMITFMEEHFRYDRDAGKLYWAKLRKPRGRAFLGGQVGCLHADSGYLRTRLMGKLYRVSHLIWLVETGSFPAKMIDHIDGDRVNNRIGNLREASSRENLCNKKIHRSGKLPGTTRVGKGKWQAQAQIGPKSHYLGWHSSESDAHLAYRRFLDERGIK